MNDKDWKEILGNDIYENIDIFKCQQLEQKLQQNSVTGDLYHPYKLYLQEDSFYSQALPKMEFEYFYRFFLQIAISYGKQRGVHILQICNGYAAQIALNVLKGIAKIPIRCLIEDIQLCKADNLLYGDDKYAQYADYDKRFLRDPMYIRKICDKYPELLRLLLVKIKSIVEEMLEICQALKNDKRLISEQVFECTQFHKILSFELGVSDAHTGGRTVAKLDLDNGKKLIYKPRGLGKEIIYQEIYEFLSIHAGLEVRKRKILMPNVNIAKALYSWEEYINFKECSSEEEVIKYFRRIGIQLFLCHILSASDIHGENLIASGEYPEFIDLEVMPGNIRGESSAQDEKTILQRFIQRSVMHTGILPYFVWGAKGDGVVLSALHSEEIHQTPFKLPVVLNQGTSEIKLSYAYKEVNLGSSLPFYQGKAVSICDHVEDICAGFQASYRAALAYKDLLEEMILPIFLLESRYLLRHTQQYDMYLNASLAPEFMIDTMNRIYLLHVLKKRGIKDKSYDCLFSYELEAMMNLEVPIYFFRGTEKTLLAGDAFYSNENYDISLSEHINLYNSIPEKKVRLKSICGTEYAGYFTNNAKEFFNEKWENLSERDLEHQMMLIRLSIACTLADGSQYLRLEQKTVPSKGSIQSIANYILKLSVDECRNISSETKGFFALKLYEKSWKIEPVGMDLYDGLPGLAVFFGVLSQNGGTGYVSGLGSGTETVVEYGDILGGLCRRMFSYTDEILSGKRKSDSAKTGMYAGEGSVVHAYLLLYQICKDNIFLKYAQKHAEIVRAYVNVDSEMDLLAGNAGWIIVLLKLYRASQREEYLSRAVALGDSLWEKAKEFSAGCGWLNAGQEKPLAGMAHGNSGFIYAYANLLEYKKDSKYIRWIQKLVEYEDSLYSDEAGNWMDIRNGGCTITNAWCHGGSGIVLSRLKLYQLPEFHTNVRVKSDLAKGLECLKRWRDDKKVCICHGIAGKYMIMKKCNSVLRLKELELEISRMEEHIGRIENVPVQEFYSTAFMSGIMGLGIVLSDVECDIIM